MTKSDAHEIRVRRSETSPLGRSLPSTPTMTEEGTMTAGPEGEENGGKVYSNWESSSSAGEKSEPSRGSSDMSGGLEEYGPANIFLHNGQGEMSASDSSALSEYGESLSFSSGAWPCKNPRSLDTDSDEQASPYLGERTAELPPDAMAEYGAPSNVESLLEHEAEKERDREKEKEKDKEKEKEKGKDKDKEKEKEKERDKEKDEKETEEKQKSPKGKRHKERKKNKNSSRKDTPKKKGKSKTKREKEKEKDEKEPEVEDKEKEKENGSANENEASEESKGQQEEEKVVRSKSKQPRKGSAGEIVVKEVTTVKTGNSEEEHHSN